MEKTLFKSVRVCIGYLKREIKESKCMLAIVLTLLFASIYTEEILDFSRTTAYGISPWIGVFFTTTRFPRLIMEVLFLLLICDIPFRKRNDMFFLLRSKRTAFCIGNLLYVQANAAVFSAAVVFFSGIWGIGRMDWTTQWGKIIGTLSFTDAGDTFTHSVQISSGLVSGQKPIVCAWMAFLLFYLCNVMLGEVLVCCNLFAKGKNRGILACCVLILWDFMVQSNPALWKYAYFSPVSWSNLTCLDLSWNVTQFPSIRYAWGMYAVWVVLLGATAVTLGKRIRICEEQE